MSTAGYVRTLDGVQLAAVSPRFVDPNQQQTRGPHSNGDRQGSRLSRDDGIQLFGVATHV